MRNIQVLFSGYRISPLSYSSNNLFHLLNGAFFEISKCWFITYMDLYLDPSSTVFTGKKKWGLKNFLRKWLLLVAQIADNQLLKGGRNRSAHCKANDQINECEYKQSMKGLFQKGNQE